MRTRSLTESESFLKIIRELAKSETLLNVEILRNPRDQNAEVRELTSAVNEEMNDDTCTK